MAGSWDFLIKVWLILQVYAAASAWLLSALGMLNGTGYLLALPPALFCIRRIWKQSQLRASDFRRDAGKLARRLKTPLPATIAIIWLLSVIGGFAWPSTYVDSLSYRLPRIVHWLSEGSWHWIHADDSRVNVVGSNMEFCWLPLFLIFKSDRPLFLTNLLAYTFMPGLLFQFLREMRVSTRAAWRWMWIFPAGYVYALQAASLGGDAYSTSVAMAAVTLALRARRTQSLADVWISILAAAFLTGIKQVTVPLGLVWLPAILASWPLMRARLLPTAMVAMLGILISFVPQAIANSTHAGSWKGFSPKDLAMWEQDSAVWGMIGNIFTVIIQNLAPPLFPWAERWNHAMAAFNAHHPIGQHFKYEHFMFAWLPRGVAEHSATLGGPLALLLIAAFMARFWRRPGNRPAPALTDLATTLVRWLPLAAALVFLAKSSVAFNGRYISPYYPFFLPCLLGTASLNAATRSAWWRRAGLALNIFTIALILLSRQRPMWPVQFVSDQLAAHGRAAAATQLSRTFLTLHRTRGLAFAQIEAAIPKGETIVGYADGRRAYLEWPLWQPWGSRVVRRVRQEDSPEDLRARKIRYVLVDPSALVEEQEPPPGAIDEWVRKYRGRIVGRFEASLEYNMTWTAYLVRLDD